MRDEAEFIAADQQARTAALDVSRSFIVQAPAGSGKTELLIQRYLRLLLIVEHPEEILAITFTRKAAFEMQKRIVAVMQDAKHRVEAKEAHEQTTLEAARRALERDVEKGWRLIESPHRLRIQTIDALNAAIARSLPLSSGLGATVDVAADDTARALYRAAAAATLDWLVTGGDNGAAIEKLLVHLDNNSALFVGHVARMLETRDQWLGITGTGQDQPFDEPAVRSRLESNIAGQIDAQLQTIANLVPAELTTQLLRLGRYAAANLARNFGPAHPLHALRDRHAMPAATAAEVHVWRAFAELLLTRSGRWRRAVRKIGFPPGDDGQKKQMLAVLEALADRSALVTELQKIRRLPAPRYSHEQWSVLLALIRVLPLAVAELRRIFSDQRVTDYIEVSMAAHAALGNLDDPGDMALLLDYSVAHLLIDEMQDTSIAQYELIEKLVAGWQPDDGRTLFCVGDPMQSIYRFRNAEVGEFLVARDRGVGDVQLHSLVLRRNFRSGEHLVHWFNTVFAGLFPAVDEVAAGAIAYAESVPVEAHRDRGSLRIHPLFGSSREEEADCGVRVIRDCLRAGDDQSVAVLVRSRTQLPLLLAKLRAAGIDYQAVDIDRLTDLPEIVDLLALTRAMCHRDDRIAWLGLLRGPWIGLTWTDLHALVMNDTKHTVWQLLQDEARIANLSADAQARLAALRQELGPWLNGHGTFTLQETVERLWYRLGGPCLPDDAGQVDNVYRFFDVLERLETAGTLADVAELESRLDQERVPTRAAQGTRLQIMTMHKAKGLQFDHVVLYGLGRRAKRESKSVLSWLNVPDRSGGKDILISPLGARSDLESDPLHNLIETRLREKDQLEQDRLLYVACTRARGALHLIGHVPLARDGTGFREPLSGSLLQRIWPAVRDEFAAAFAAVERPGGDDSYDRTGFRLPVLHRLDRLLPRPELPFMPKSPHIGDPADLVRDRPVDYHWAGSAARHAGSIVHRCLQQLTEGQLTIDGVRDAALMSLTGRWAAELGVPGDSVAEVCARAREALNGVLQDETGRWIVFGPGYAELPVTGIRNGKIESIVIDRVRIDEQGVHWIVDYKTGTHEGGELDLFLQQEVDRYRPQLTRYASLYRNLTDAAVRAALYFPLLQRFCQVPLDEAAP